VDAGARLVNATNGATLATTVERAETAWRRFVGLMGRKALPQGHCLVIPGCNSIHMCFMRFPIDVLFLDTDHRVRALRHGLKPWRLASGGWGYRDTVELPAGTLAATATLLDHVVQIVSP
jgi:uncharacterized membrane protein (UPF0127 family)